MDLSIISRAESHAADLSKLADEATDVFDNVVQRITDKKPTTSRGEPRRKDGLHQVGGGNEPRRGMPKVLSTPALATLPEMDEDEITTIQPPTGSVTTQKPIPRSESLLNLLTMSTRERDEFKQREHYDDLFGAFTRNFGKGFALGFGGRFFLNILMELVAIAKRGRKLPFSEVALDGAKDHGVFFGLLLATNNSLMFASKNLPLDPRVSRYRAVISGFIAGCASLWALPTSMRRTVVIFTLVRSVEVAVRIGVRSGRLPNFDHGDTLLMSLSSAMMIYTYVFHTKALDQSYVHFLNRHAQFPPVFVRAIGLMQTGVKFESLHDINEHRIRLALPGPPPPPIENPLAYDDPSLSATDKARLLLHPTRPFALFALLFFIRGLVLAAPVYGPVYLIPLVLFRRAKLLKNPIGVGKAELLSIARSSAFLSLYCTLGIAGLSLGRQLGIRHDIMGQKAAILPAISGFMGGLATIIEKKPRRIELALYVASKAFEGAHNVLIDKFGHLASLPGSDVFVFSSALALILHGNLRYIPREEIVSVPTHHQSEGNASQHKTVRTPGVVRDVYRDHLLRFFDTDSRHTFFGSDKVKEIHHG